MRFFIIFLTMLSLSPSVFADDFARQAFGFYQDNDDDDNRSSGEVTNPFNFFSNLWNGDKQEKVKPGELRKITPHTLKKRREAFRKKYDPHGIVPDRCVVRNYEIPLRGYNRNGNPRVLPVGGGGYTRFLYDMEHRGKRDRSWNQRKKFKRQMLPCPDRFDQVAKKINIIVDKANKDHRQDRGRKQSMSVYITYADGRKEKWEKMLISTGNSQFGISKPSSGPSITPTGTFHLNWFGENPDGSYKYPDRIEKDQAYCVRGMGDFKNGNGNDSYGFPMPNGTQIRCGYYFHSGQWNGVTGGPRSHGCVRMKFDDSRKLYCLMRQRGLGAYADTNHRRTTVHVVQDLKKEHPDDIEAAKWNTQIVPRPQGFKNSCGGGARMEMPLNLNPVQ